MDDLTNCSILVVDDAEANLDILVEILADDYDISVAMDGEGALEAVEEDIPDLILLDIMMPGMDGFEVLKRLKTDERTRDIGVIFITGATDQEDTDKGLEMGALDFIAKPINPPIVKARVKNYLELILLRRTR